LANNVASNAAAWCLVDVEAVHLDVDAMTLAAVFAGLGAVMTGPSAGVEVIGEPAGLV
jgi:hypothetical protein